MITFSILAFGGLLCYVMGWLVGQHAVSIRAAQAIAFAEEQVKLADATLAEAEDFYMRAADEAEQRC